MIGYAYNPATLPTGAQTYTTSTGDMQLLYDKNFSEGQVGHDASYMRVIEAYQLKRQIDQEAANALALYNAAYVANNESRRHRFDRGTRLLQRVRLDRARRHGRGQAHVLDDLRRGHLDDLVDHTGGQLRLRLQADGRQLHRSGGHRHVQGVVQVVEQDQLRNDGYVVVRHHGVVRRARERHPDALRVEQRRALRHEVQFDVQLEQPERAQSGRRLRRSCLQRRLVGAIGRRSADVE